MSERRKLRVGTRKSQLALAQTESVIQALVAKDSNIQAEVVPMLTTGDRSRSTPADAPRDKNDWILELEAELVSNNIDIAVHSGKDVPVEVHSETELIPVLERADARDVLVLGPSLREQLGESSGKFPLQRLTAGVRVGTSSLRRKAQILVAQKEVEVVPIRGNVPTRLRKLEEGEVDALVLAAAGLNRLNIQAEGVFQLEPVQMLPAMNQGTLLVQCLRGDSEITGLLESISDPETRAACLLERTFIRLIGADCGSAVGVYAECRGENIEASGRVFAKDGSRMLEHSVSGKAEQAEELGSALGKVLIEQGAQSLL